MNVEKGLKRLTLFLAILVGVICGGITIGLLIDKRSSALRHLAWCEKEFRNSIPVAEPNERPAGWPFWSPRDSSSEYLLKLYTFLHTKHANLPLLFGEEDKKYREKHDIPPDSPDRFYTDESIKFLRIYGSCLKKSRSFEQAHYNFWTSLHQIEFIGMLVLAGSGSTLAGFCGVWLIYKLLEWLVIGFRNEKSKDEQKE